VDAWAFDRLCIRLPYVPYWFPPAGLLELKAEKGWTAPAQRRM
jgi:hypothetical protein